MQAINSCGAVLMIYPSNVTNYVYRFVTGHRNRCFVEEWTQYWQLDKNFGMCNLNVKLNRFCNL